MWDEDRKQSKADFSAVCWWGCSVKLLKVCDMLFASALYDYCQFESFFNCSSKSIWTVPYRNSRKLTLNSIQTQENTVPKGRMRLF